MDAGFLRAEKYSKYWLFFWSLLFAATTLYVNIDFFSPVALPKNKMNFSFKVGSKSSAVKQKGFVEVFFDSSEKEANVEISQNEKFAVGHIIIEARDIALYKNGSVEAESGNLFKHNMFFGNATKLNLKRIGVNGGGGTVKVIFKKIDLDGIFSTLLVIFIWILLLNFSYRNNQAALVVATFVVYTLTMYAEKVTFDTLSISSVFGTLFLCLLVFSILFLLFYFAKKIGRQRFMAIFNGFVFMMIAFVPICLIAYKISFGVGFGAEAVNAILQTNQQEAVEYLMDCVSLKAVLFSAVSIALLFYIAFWHRNSDIKAVKLPLMCLLVAVSSVLSLFYADNIRLPKFFTRAYNKYMTELNQFKELQNQRKTVSIQAKKEGTGETYIFVIGEAQNKNHMQIYGYSRDTTPKLQDLLNKKEIEKFDGIYSCHSETMPVLSLALTEASQYNDKSYFESASIVEILKASGFETVWLTNQNLLGVWDNLVSIIANQADRIISTNKSVGATTKTQRLDGDLLPYIKKELSKNSSKNRAIFVHLMGSHISYCSRFPKEFEIFKDDLDIGGFAYAGFDDENLKRSVNCYDNSILYNDFVVSSIVEEIKRMDGVCALVYMPDHGEDVLGQVAHDVAKFTFEMTQIPMLAYFSQEYKTIYKENYETFISNKNRLFSNDMFYDTIIGLTGVSTNLYNSKFDLSSRDYELKDEDAKTLNGKRKYNEAANIYSLKRKNGDS